MAICKNILYRNGKYYVELIKINNENIYHVFFISVTHSICESAYESLDLAICRTDYLVKNKIIINK